jgi:hypothetical protein
MSPEAIVSVPNDVRFTHAPLGHRDQIQMQQLRRCKSCLGRGCQPRRMTKKGRPIRMSDTVQDGRPEGRQEGRLAATHPDPAWGGAVVDDSSPGSTRSMKCCRATGPNQILKMLKKPTFVGASLRSVGESLLAPLLRSPYAVVGCMSSAIPRRSSLRFDCSPAT